jgi:hypothetical protein
LCLVKDLLRQNMNMPATLGLPVTDWSSRFKQPLMTPYKIWVLLAGHAVIVWAAFLSSHPKYGHFKLPRGIISVR